MWRGWRQLLNTVCVGIEPTLHLHVQNDTEYLPRYSDIRCQGVQINACRQIT
jgi:hypothetical protein